MSSLQIVCPQCDAINRVPADKPAAEGKCGMCHRELFSGMPLELNAEKFQRQLQYSDIPLLADFWAAWAGREMMAPVLQAARQLTERQAGKS